MKIKVLIISVLLTTLSSCFIFELPFIGCAPPNKKEHKYYNPDFVLDPLSGLQTKDKIYIARKYIPDIPILFIEMFVFFDNGIVKKNVIRGGEKIPKRLLSSRFGSHYYITKNDSIMFITDPCDFDDGDESVYKGRLKGDTLFLKRYYTGLGNVKHGKVDDYVLVAKSIAEVKAMLAKE